MISPLIQQGEVMAHPKMSLERFMKKVEPVPEAGCWLWTGSLFYNGYGQVHHLNRPVGAHRLSWLFHKGAIPDDMQVLHRCDVRSCVNPDHLWLGTHGDNMRDMVRKGRNPKGTGRFSVKLTESGVRYIRRSKKQQKALAKMFGVGQSAISDIQLHKTWKHVQ